MPENLTPDTETPDTGTPDFTEIGGSPVPGLTLRYVLRGHTDKINRIAWSPDGKYLASPSDDRTIRVWDVSTEKCIVALKGHTDTVINVAWSPKKYELATSSSDGTICIWNFGNNPVDNRVIGKHEKKRFAETFGVEWISNGHAIAFSPREQPIQVWDIGIGSTISVFGTDTSFTMHLECSPDNRYLATRKSDVLTIWNTKNWNLTLELSGLKNGYSFAWFPSGQVLGVPTGASIVIWTIEPQEKTVSLEGHTNEVRHVSFSFDGKFLASKAKDNTIRIWRCDDWKTVATFSEKQGDYWAEGGIAFHPNMPILATLGENNTAIRIWELDEAILLSQAKESVNYTTAKLVLVGDSGVGKTGLGWRLAHGEFKEHASTHGQQFWSVPQLNLKRKDGTDCEAVLWDLAGQHVYRQVHSIFLDNVAAALVLFDPTNRQEPLKGAQFWLEQLKGKGQLPPTVLVGARVDRGAPALSQDELNQFCQRYGIQGGYISTSALKGDGLDELLEIVKAQIPWDYMTATVTTVTFKRIKDYVLSLKEKTDRKGVLVSPAELRKLGTVQKI